MIKNTLKQAITQGGTTLRDFTNSEGQPGYFQQSLHVYGKAGENCSRCGAVIETSRLGGRSVYYCPGCQV